MLAASNVHCNDNFNLPLIDHPKSQCKRIPFPSAETGSIKNLYHRAVIGIFGLSEQGKKVQALTVKSQLDTSDIQTIVEAFKSDEFSRLNHMFLKILAKQPPVEVNTILKAIFKAHAFDDTKILFKKLNSLLTLQKIEDAIHSEHGEFKGAIATAIEMSASANRNIESKATIKANSIRSHISYYLNTTVEWFVDSVLLVLQLTDVTDNDATKIEKQMVAQMRYMAFRENIVIISAWLVALALYTGSALVTSLIVAATTTVFVTSYVIYKNFLKPCPDNVHPGKNRTAEASRGEIASIHGRNEIVKKLFDTLEGNTKTRARRYPMIRGGTGVGKSDLANAMALFLISKDCPKEWKGKKLFVVSTADIVAGGAHGKMEHLHHIKDVLEGREENAILFFTEVHVGFQEKTFFLGQELKTLCDAPGGFPYMIFATTEREYMEHIAKDSAFARRLDFFDIEPTSDETTQLIVSDMVAKEASDIFVTNEAIREVSAIRSQFIDVDGKMMQVFENCPQPATSIAITAKALANARHPWFKTQEEHLEKLKSERCLLDNQLKLERGDSYLPYSNKGKSVFEALYRLDEQILVEEALLDKAKTNLEQFRDLVKKTSNLQEEIERASVEMRAKAEMGTLSIAEIKSFLFMLSYMKPAMDECLKDLGAEVQNSNAIIDKDKIQEFIRSEAVSYLRKVKEKQSTIKPSKTILYAR